MEKKKINISKLKENVSNAASSISDTAVKAGEKAKELAVSSKEAIFNAVDQNGNGEIDIEDVILMGFQTPGVYVNRTDFLQKEFFKKYPQGAIDVAIASTPAKAGISTKDIDKVANEVIQFERTMVSGISAALSTTGPAAMAATIPADIAQYYGHILKVTQKLLYLYGFPQIDVPEKGHQLDSETMNILILCLGVMYGVSGANEALKTLAKSLGTGVEKKLIRASLTKGTIYPVVKKVAKWFGINMNKTIFANFFNKSINVVGTILGGTLTYMSFKPCCDKLKASLENTLLSNPDYYEESVNEEIIVIN